MNLCRKKIFLAALFLSSSMQIFTVTQPEKTLSEYDEFVLKNKLMQDIYNLLDEMGYTTNTQKKDIMSFIFRDDEVQSLLWPVYDSTDKANILAIKREIANLMYKSKNEAKETQHLVSYCLKSLPKRGVAYKFSTILYCFQLSKNQINLGK